MNYSFKCVIVGDSGTGKTCITQRLVADEFKEDSTNTIGVEFDVKKFDLEDGYFSKLKLWTTGGDSRFSGIISSYYKGTSCFVIVYDVTNRKSFENITDWIDKISQKVEISNKKIFLIGNKIDSTENRKISYEEGMNLANRFNFIFNEVSAKTGENIQKTFENIVKELNKNVEKLEQNPNNGIEKTIKEKYSRTCFFW